LPSQQPGFGLNGTLQKLSVALWLGPGQGIGANFAGCWSKPEIISEPDGLKIVYDLGALDGKSISLAIITSTGEKEIFLVDGGRLGLAESLLERGELLTGTPRFSLYNGDGQLIYTKYGTIATLRMITHETGDINQSLMATNLNESETAAWVEAMSMSSEMLWPTKLAGNPRCKDAILLAPTYGSQVALLCSMGKSKYIDSKNETRMTYLGSYSPNKSETFYSKQQRYSIGQITELAGYKK
jgi:hypothetical protein